MRTLLTTLLLGLLLAAVAAPAHASRSQASMVQDDALLVSSGSGVRSQTLDEIQALGVDIVKARISWRDIAPGGATKPAGFEGSNPAEYSAAQWDPFDEIVRGAQARGMGVLLLLGGRAPDWATSGRSSTPGVSRPDAAEFGRFVQAVGTRYSGSYGALPRVSMYSVWNEPNLGSWLSPQRSGRTPVAPSIYRGLVQAADAALDASGHGNDVLLIGELLPFGRRGGSNKTRPLDFLREMACVDSRFRRYRGGAARARGCTDFRPVPGDGLAFHPYTPTGGPRTALRSPEDVSISTLSRLTRTLDRLGRGGRLAQRRMSIYITEFGFQTDPPDIFQTPISRVPAYMGESEYIAYRNSRVKTYSQYPLRDDALSGRGFARYSGFQSGLRFEDGRVKPGVYDAFRLPFYVRLRSSSSVDVFGAVRAGQAGRQVTIESAVGRSGFRPVATAQLGENGYFRTTVRSRVAEARRFRFVSGDETSRAARPQRR